MRSTECWEGGNGGLKAGTTSVNIGRLSALSPVPVPAAARRVMCMSGAPPGVSLPRVASSSSYLARERACLPAYQTARAQVPRQREYMNSSEEYNRRFVAVRYRCHASKTYANLFMRV